MKRSHHEDRDDDTFPSRGRHTSAARDPEAFASDEEAHAYPADLARAVHARWPEVQAAIPPGVDLPEVTQLEAILSVCYQASLLREEGRPVTFRVALGKPAIFRAEAGPPTGLHRLVFSDFRPFDQHELRRLAPSATFSRSLIGAVADPERGAQIWGLIHSGPHWLESVRGGRQTPQSFPPMLVVAVTGPGRVLVSAGTVTVAELTHGTLVSRGMDVFQAPWLQQYLTLPRGPEQPNATGFSLASHVLRRVLATVRGTQHGGMLVILPAERAGQILDDARDLRLKYPFRDEEPRRRLASLTARIEDALARRPAATGELDETYDANEDAFLGDLDEALFETAHFVADLTHVDGAVVLTTGLDLLGFGGEIASAPQGALLVARARGLTSTDREWVRTDRVGTRHRSAYRLCQSLPDALVLVVSQDGGLRFVRWADDAVTYWEQVATAPWEV